ncbi:MAG: sodium:proton antiporter NhaD [Candidatus Sericytochromatia bacterium]
MILAIILTFVLSYIIIIFEHPLKINKTASGLIGAVVCWVLYAIFNPDGTEKVLERLNHHLSDIAQIIFFVLGAMTIVEIIDSHKGFKTITDLIKTNDKKRLLWLISLMTFFLSSILDNLTTAIIMVSLLRKIIYEKEERMIFSSMVIIASNAGGAWSPIGDITTTMLWIGGQISSFNIIKQLFIPSFVSLLVPLIYQSLFIKGKLTGFDEAEAKMTKAEEGSRRVFFLGLGSLIFVPAFKTLTHLPPYLGIILCLSIIWVVTDLLHYEYEERNHLRVTHALGKIDITSILFFLGILLSIGVLESVGILKNLAFWLDNSIGNKDIIVSIIGLASAIIDNVPLVAASMGMYDLATYPTDSKIWEMLAYCAGTGGSILIIGSAAGVVVMGMENISFLWYLKKISFMAFLGYLSGLLVFMLLN